MSTGCKRKKEFDGHGDIDFLMDLINEKSEKTVGLSLFGKYQKSFVNVNNEPKNIAKLPHALTNLFEVSNRSLTSSELSEKIEKLIPTLAVTDDEARYLEEVTRTQADNLVWHQQRVGRITGSTIHSLAHTSPDNPSKSIIKRLSYMSNNKLSAPALIWGRENEHVALLAYFNTYSNPDYFGDSLCINGSIDIHADLSVNDCGLTIRKKEPWFGASPDSIVSCTCCGKGVVEVKCPFSCKDGNLQTKIDSGTFYIKKKNGLFLLEKTHSYYYQVQHEMYVCELSYCDFVVWSPKEFLVTRIEIDNEFIAVITAKCFKLWKNFIMPELLCRFMEEQQTS